MHRFRVVFGLCALAASAGCTLYHAQPLEDRELQAVLAPPDRAALERAAPLLMHPRLPPMALALDQPLTPDELAVVSVLANPDLRALRLQQGVADAQVFASGLLPDPQLGLGRDRVASAPDATYSAAWAGSLALDVLGPLVTRGAERAAAQAHASSVRLDIAWAEWTTAGQARLLAVRLHYQRLAAGLARSAAATADRALARSLAAGERRDLKADEIELRRIAATDAAARSLAAERDADATRLELNRMLGFPPLAPLVLAPPPALNAWHGADAAALFTVARIARLDLKALAADYDSQQAVVRRAVLGQYPRVALTLNRARDTSRVYTSGQAVGLDLPLWNRNRGVLRIADADRARLRAEYAARLHQARADIAALVAALELDERARAAREAQASELERIAVAYEAAASRGDVTQAVADAARAAALDSALALLAVQQACAEERIGLALAVGQPLTDLELAP
jgi:outer membrane protein TolC